ncbi:BON domain-containing protein [Geotalea sp. SG265]|uniref:BON domain-containing protein n=1 Tax=Geotalea sp. SG265 TaxID=2922867 RepID=UPI001FAEB2AA|nr:BON domain-containing protein [Geotalea sp. SG265]
MKRTLPVVLILASLLPACSGVPVQRTAEFEKADTNNDGKIVLAEWIRYGGAEASFVAADVDRKGSLNEAQFRQALRYNDEATGNGTARQQKVMDDQILADVKLGLSQSREINGWNIKTEVYQGNVTLSGAVRTGREKQVAEQIASGVMGVKAVFNQIVIKQ